MHYTVANRKGFQLLYVLFILINKFSILNNVLLLSIICWPIRLKIQKNGKMRALFVLDLWKARLHVVSELLMNEPVFGKSTSSIWIKSVLYLRHRAMNVCDWCDWTVWNDLWFSSCVVYGAINRTGLSSKAILHRRHFNEPVHPYTYL